MGWRSGARLSAAPEAGRSYGNHVYAALDETLPDGYHRWNALGTLDGGPAPDIAELRKRLEIPPDFLAHLAKPCPRARPS